MQNVEEVVIRLHQLAELLPQESREKWKELLDLSINAGEADDEKYKELRGLVEKMMIASRGPKETLRLFVFDLSIKNAAAAAREDKDSGVCVGAAVVAGAGQSARHRI